MDYFDALARSSFKRTADGRRLFFPWAALGRGYTVASEEEFDRLRRNVRTYLVICVPLALVAVIWKGIGDGLTLLPLLLLPYVLWARAQRLRLRVTAERLTWSESVLLQARGHSMAVLWLLEAGALAFVAAGVLILLVDRSHWLAGVASIAFFGLCAVVCGRMLIVKKRDATGP